MPGSTHVVAITASSVLSPIFTADCGAVRILADHDCHVRFIPANASGSASTLDMLVAKNLAPEYYAVSNGWRLAVIRSGTGVGNLYVTEGTP